AAPTAPASGRGEEKLIVVHPFEIGDQSRPGRVPSEPRLRLRTGSREIHAGKWCKPSEMTRRLLWRQRDYRHPKASADDLSDVANRDAFFADCVVPRTGFSLLQGQPVETRDVGDVRRRPAVFSVADIGRNALLARQRHGVADKTLFDRVVNLGKP